jgi:hypothetical protein
MKLDPSERVRNAVRYAITVIEKEDKRPDKPAEKPAG